MITALVYVTGGVRTRLPAALPAVASLVGDRARAAARGALAGGLATALYACAHARGALGLPAPQGLADVRQVPPGAALVYPVFVLGVACATVALLGAYLSREPAPCRPPADGGDGAGGRPARAEPGDRRQHPERPHDHRRRGPVLYVNAFGERILGRARPSVRGTGRPRGPRLAAAGAGRAAGPGAATATLARLERRLRAPRRPDAAPRRLRDAARGAGGARGYLDRVPGPHRDPAARAGGAHQGEAGGGGRDGGPARARDPQPARLDPRLGPGADGRARARRGAGPPARHHLARVEAALRHAQPVPVPGAPAAAARATRSTCGRSIESARHAAPQRQRGQAGPPGRASSADEGPHVCLADPDQITQVFWNLARNALEAMPDGGRLDVSLLRARRRTSCSPCATRAAAWRARSSGGSSSRSSASAAARARGSGLAIVYRIVREHGGDISVRSAPAERGHASSEVPRCRAWRAGAACGGREVTRHAWSARSWSSTTSSPCASCSRSCSARRRATTSSPRKAAPQAARRAVDARASTWSSPTCSCPTATASRSCATSRRPRRRRSSS